MKKLSKPYLVMKSAVEKSYTPTLEEIQRVNSFFLVRYISNDPNTIYIANALNCNHKIPIEAQYNFIRNSTLDKVAFITYPKKKVLDHSTKFIMEHFNVKEDTAKEYIQILGPERIQEISNKYKCGKII